MTTISTAVINNIINCLKNERNRDSTRKNYHAIWKIFSRFYLSLDNKPDSWEDCLVLFTGYLITKNRKVATVRSYISAIKTVLKEDDIVISEDRFLLNSLVKASRLCNNHVRIRFPVQKQLVHELLRQIDRQFTEAMQPYAQKLFMAMISTTYYGLF